MSPPDLSSLSKLLPPPAQDPRFTHRSALLNGQTYGYIHAPVPPSTPYRATIVLIHGFPDLSFAWRNQIPYLTSLGLEVIAPDCLGYGRSDSPPTSSIAKYTFARIADDIEELCRQLNIPWILLGGHDWGGAIVYRIALMKPRLVKAVFSICTPFDSPKPVYTPLAQAVARKVPNFAYQLHFASGEYEDNIQTKDDIRAFLNALYGARTVEAFGHKGGELMFQATGRARLDLLARVGKNTLLSDEEMDFYVTEYARHGINGPLNWYRTREANFLNELDFFFDGVQTDPAKYKEGAGKKGQIQQPTLFVFATKDAALPEWMSRGMDKSIPHLTRRTVEGGHWILWQKADEVTEILKEWLGKILNDIEKSKL